MKAVVEVLAWPLHLPALTSKDINGLQIFLAIFSVFRASDYLFSARPTVTYAELAFPLWTWATACLTIAWLLLVGIASATHYLVWLGHALGAATYLGLSLGALLQAIDTTPEGPIIALIHWPWWLLALTLFAASPLTAACAATRLGRDVGKASAAATIAAATIAAIVAFSPIIELDGARAIGPLATVMLLHGYLAVRMAPTPTTPGAA